MALKIGIIITIFLVGALGFIKFNRVPNSSSDNPPIPLISTPIPTEFEAKFLIYTNRTQRIFTDPKYHNRSTVAFITSDNPNLITIKSNNITWQEFFDTLPSPMKVAANCLTTGTGQVFCNTGSTRLRFFINGNENSEALEQFINPGDKLLVTYGEGENINIELEALSKL